MFKKTDENEWSRFSKALSSKEREARERELEVTDEEASPLEPPIVSQVPAPSPSTPRPAQDVNVTVARSTKTVVPELGDEHESLVAERTLFDGVLRAEESIRILGSVQGEVESKRSVFVEEQAKVTAKVTGMSVSVAGQVNGQIFCAGRVEIKPSGRVTGEITAGTLIMQEGAFFEGNLKMASRNGEEPKG